jgi:very-short-patch-repair endonuclease
MQARAKELRHELTPAEKKLWARLRNGQVNGLQFRRQHAVGTYIVDFYCAKAKRVIEVDGDSHAEQIEYDQARTEYLNERGYTVYAVYQSRSLQSMRGRITADCR